MIKIDVKEKNLLKLCPSSKCFHLVLRENISKTNNIKKSYARCKFLHSQLVYQNYRYSMILQNLMGTSYIEC
jgi:hypothetical protein